MRRLLRFLKTLLSTGTCPQMSGIYMSSIRALSLQKYRSYRLSLNPSHQGESMKREPIRTYVTKLYNQTVTVRVYPYHSPKPKANMTLPRPIRISLRVS